MFSSRGTVLKSFSQIYRDVPENMQELKDSMLLLSWPASFHSLVMFQLEVLWLPDSVLWAGSRHAKLLLTTSSPIGLRQGAA